MRRTAQPGCGPWAAARRQQSGARAAGGAPAISAAHPEDKARRAQHRAGRKLEAVLAAHEDVPLRSFFGHDIPPAAGRGDDRERAAVGAAAHCSRVWTVARRAGGEGAAAAVCLGLSRLCGCAKACERGYSGKDRGASPGASATAAGARTRSPRRRAAQAAAGRGT